MAHSKKTLQSYLMTLQAYRDCMVKATASERRLVYEVSMLVRDARDNSLQKNLFFVPGHTILSDDPGQVVSCWIHMLSSKEIQDYEEKCRKYGI